MSQSDHNDISNAYLRKLIEQNPTLIYTGTSVHRKSAKLEFSENFEELKQEMANALGCPVEVFEGLNLEAEKEKMREHWNAVELTVKAYKEKLNANPGQPASKYDELYDVGRFMTTLDGSLKLIVDRKNEIHPDFVVMSGNKTIGIEHTRLISTDVIEKHKRTQKYTKEAEKIIRDNMPEYRGIVNLWFNYKKPEEQGYFFTRKDYWKQIPPIIAAYVEDVVKGRPNQCPVFIENISVSSSESDSFSLIKSEDYFTPDNCIELIQNAIAGKEKKFNNYITNTESDNCWLLIVVDGEKDYSSFDLRDFSFPPIESSPFQRIYLFERFANQIISLYYSDAQNS